MKDTIRELARGNGLDHPLKLCFRPDKIEASIAANQNYRGELELWEQNRRQMKGLVYSSHRRVRVLTDQFAAGHASIPYEVDVSGLNPGDRIDGCFYLVTAGGERELPFSFEMTVPVGRTAYEKLRSVEAFADLARQDFDVALQIFENSSFLSLPFMQRPAFAALYHGLYGHGSRRGALEEFLVGCGAKEQVRLTVDEKTHCVTDPETDVYDSIHIERSTWGAVQITASCDAAFLELESRQLSEASFEGDACDLHFTIHPQLMHAGRNFGRVTLTTPYQQFVIEVAAAFTSGMSERMQRRELRQSYIRFYRNFVELFTRDFRSDFLINNMLSELASLRDSAPTSDMVQLFHAHILLLAGQKEKAQILLADAKERILSVRREDTDIYCYYTYLRVLDSESEEDMEQLVKILRLYEGGEHPSEMVCLLLLLTDSTLRDNPLTALAQLKKLYESGSRTPFLYLAACRMMEKQPLLLTELGDFELRSLLFGAKESMVGSELAHRVALFSEGEKTFRPSYYHLLTRLAADNDDPELVTAICRILISGGKKGPEWFSWYEKGVKQDARLTRLYEYYLSSLPEGREGELPHEIYLYFSYTNSLDTNTRSVLYDNILTYFKPGDEIYESYSRQMSDFARDQAFSGHMDSRLARIYQELIPAGILDEKLAAVMPKYLYSSLITCDNPRMEQVVISYEEWDRQEQYPLKDGCAAVFLYSDAARILFQDARGCRYACAPSGSVRLMDAPELLAACERLCPNDPYLLLHQCRELLDRGQDDEDSLSVYEKVLNLQGLRELFSRQLTSRLLDSSISGNTASRLMQIGSEHVAPEDQVKLAEALIEEDYCARAFEIVRRCGCEQIRPNYLLKLCSAVCVDMVFAKDDFLIQACLQCFQDRRSDDVILEYLCRYYNGPSDQMLQILMKACQYHTDLSDMPERLLAQMLFSGCREGMDDVYEVYDQGEAVDSTLIRAYVTQKCYDFLTADVAAPDQVFARAQQLCAQDDIPFVCRLALCKYLSLSPSRTEEQTKLCTDFITDCCERGLVFDFFSAFSAEDGYPASLRGQVILTYRGSEEDRLRVRYRVLPDMPDYRTEVFPYMTCGYFSRCFTVFYGERLEYDLYMENGDDISVAQHGTITAGDADLGAPETVSSADDRFARLNHLLYGLDAMDESSLKKEMKDYAVTDEMLDHYFNPL